MISIVILTWNALKKTQACLDSIFSAELPPNVKIILVDNGSTDGTAIYLDTLKRKGLAEVIRNPENLGYSKGVNQGINIANEQDDIILLNNDVKILTRSWISDLQNAAVRNHQAGVLGVRIKRPDGTLQHCGCFMPIETMWGQQIAGGELDINQYGVDRIVESVVFACAYIKRETIKEIGLLCEDYFAYFEDSDYCERVRRSGRDVVYVGGIEITHDENTSTRENKVDFNGLFLESQETFKKKWKASIFNDRYKHNLDIHSIVNFPSGYASSCREILLSLENDAIVNNSGIYAAYNYVYGEGTVFPINEPKGTDSYLLNCIMDRSFGNAEVQIVYAQGNVFEKNTGNYRIGYTMLETTGIPKEWVRQCNLMDEVWVPSHFNRETFLDSGVNVPIKVIPLGVNQNYFNMDIISRRFSDKFTFLSIFEWGERKAPETLLRAFADEFSADEDVLLVCKVNNFDPSFSVQEKVYDLKLRKRKAEIIFLHNKIIARSQIPALYRAADAFVLPTRGEGWGMPLIEAMACGLPTIATNWGAHLDFMNSGNSFLIDVEGLVPAEAKCPYYEGFRWAEPSYEHLRAVMRSVYEDRHSSTVVGQLASVAVRTLYSWDNTAKKIKEIITKL